MNYRINYNVVLYSETLYDKEIIVKNKSNELIAKCSLEDYLKKEAWRFIQTAYYNQMCS